MNVRNCRGCGKLFNYIAGQPLCQGCKEALEAKFQEAKNFIRDNKGATVKQVSRELDIEEAQIRQWVREERLEFSTEGGIGIVCEGCGLPIATGRYCDKCKVTLVNDLSAAGRRPERPQIKKPERENPRMRFLDRQ